jgi:hypothetical protein
MLIPCHLFGSFLSHVKSLDPQHEQKVPYDLLGDISLLHLIISSWYLFEPRGFALWTVRPENLDNPK